MVRSSVLLFNFWAYHFCLNFLLFCRSCLGELGSKGDRGKAPVYATSHGDDSSNDETASASKQVARFLQSRFNRREEDIGLTSSISIETHSRRRGSIEMANVSFESHIVSSKASSRCRPARGRGASGGEMRAEDLVIDIKADFSGDEVHLDLGARRCSLRPRFPPRQARADARTRAVDRGIRDIHLQRRLKDHHSIQVRKGEV